MREALWRFGLLGILLIGCLTGCQEKEGNFQRSSSPSYYRLVDTLSIQKLEVFDPWSDQPTLLARYYLLKDSSSVYPHDGLALHVPLRSVATTSATQIGFLNELGRLDCVSAMTTPHLIYNKPSQEVADIGEDINLNIEALLLTHPDAILLSAYTHDNPIAKRIEEAGIPVIYTVEWMEQDPLARASWIKMIASLIGENHQADSIWNEVRTTYQREQQLATQAKRTIMMGAPYCGTWYVPTGATYMGCLIDDAGANYAYLDRTDNTSLPLTKEEAMQSFAEADVWLGCNAQSLEELRILDEKNTWFKAYQQQQVYNFYRRQTSTGANDFWELGAVHPELILRDIRWVLYPESFSQNYQPVFIKQLTP